jgi:hypothetical protein
MPKHKMHIIILIAHDIGSLTIKSSSQLRGYMEKPLQKHLLLKRFFNLPFLIDLKCNGPTPLSVMESIALGLVSFFWIFLHLIDLHFILFAPFFCHSLLVVLECDH